MTFELNDGGNYFVMKEKLKKSIVRIVKEKFQFQVRREVGGMGEENFIFIFLKQVSNTRNAKELEAFLNELYVYLI